MVRSFIGYDYFFIQSFPFHFRKNGPDANTKFIITAARL